MPLQATSGAASYDAFGGGVAVVPNYIEECFSTTLYTGNGSTQTINNGIDLAGKGGMVWGKTRDAVVAHTITDTVRGVDKELFPNLTDAQQTRATGTGSVFAFNSNGFSTSGVNGFINYSGLLEVAWTFREQPKFFDVVTYTGSFATTGQFQTINHSLGAAPGMIIVKQTNGTNGWFVYHRSLGDNAYILLNSTAAAAASSPENLDWAVTATTFKVTAWADLNNTGATYVAYLFAHNAGGFGLTGTDNVITCGSYTGNSSATGVLQNLGYEPQWVMIKSSNDTQDWAIFDNMRGVTTGVGAVDARLVANKSEAENNSFDYVEFNATGFTPMRSQTLTNSSSNTYIYIAIRRGPMKVPTTGTSVFALNTRSNATTQNGTVVTSPSALAFDQFWMVNRGTNPSNPSALFSIFDRLRGGGALYTAYTSAESSSVLNFGNGQNSVRFTAAFDTVSTNYVQYFASRAPGFFDVVCNSSGSDSQMLLNHNLGVAPEMIIKKLRNGSANWNTWASGIPFGNIFDGPNTNGAAYTNGSLGNTTPPSATQFQTYQQTGLSYVYYLFASCPGVSKVGSYTGNGSSQTINCGFTGGARFVMIKRTDSTGDWYVWDTARGIVSGNDPHLSLNTTAAEVTSNDTIDTDSTGFVVNQVSATNVNVSSATYIFLAIA